MLDSNQDGDLSELGATPDDVRAIVTRTLGERPVTLSYADELLEALTHSVDALVPEPPMRSSQSSPAFDVAPRAAVTPLPAAAPAAPAPAPVFVAAPAPHVELPPLFDSRPVPPSFAPPLFDARPVPGEAPNVFDGPREPDAEATAQAIQAAFDEPEPEHAPVAIHDPLDTLESLPAALQLAPPLEPDLSRGKRERVGSRRPDLDLLLEQPLDALDFERSEPLAKPAPASTAQTEPPERHTPAPAAAAADDFEILVDDEILEIAEDDVEIVDEDGSS